MSQVFMSTRVYEHMHKKTANTEPCHLACSNHRQCYRVLPCV